MFEPNSFSPMRSFRKLRWSAIAVPLKSMKIWPTRSRTAAGSRMTVYRPGAISSRIARKVGFSRSPFAPARPVHIVFVIGGRRLSPNPTVAGHRCDRKLRQRLEVIAERPCGVHNHFDVLRRGVNAGRNLSALQPPGSLRSRRAARCAGVACRGCLRVIADHRSIVGSSYKASRSGRLAGARQCDRFIDRSLNAVAVKTIGACARRTARPIVGRKCRRSFGDILMDCRYSRNG